MMRKPLVDGEAKTMSTFFEEYERELKIRNGAEEADTALSRLWDSINAKGDTYTKIYRAYRESLDNRNMWLDLHDEILDVPSVISCMRENGIERFTFSYNGSGVLATSWLIIENECMLMDMVQIERQGEKIPAFLFRVE